LFDPVKSECKVVILLEGKRVNIPVDPKDNCFFEQKYFDPITNQEEDFNEIKEVKFWAEDEQGNKTDKGIVKMEYPEEFFGTTTIKEIAT
jgi:hypothetical protein